jgi:histidinol-phosphate phosphatase family protein
METERKLYIFDKDGTLVGSTAKGRPPSTREEQFVLPGVAEKLREIVSPEEAARGVREISRIEEPQRSGNVLAMASNQGGIAFGYIHWVDAMDIMYDATSKIGIEFAQIEFCPHHPGGDNVFARECACRKPLPGMLFKIMMASDFAPKDTIFVGDQETDRQAAEAAGIDFVRAKDFFGWEE